MSYSGNLYLPNFSRIVKKTNKINQDKTWHKYRTDFLNNKTHKNTYIIVYGRYDVYFDKDLNKKGKKIENSREFVYLPNSQLKLNLEERRKIFKDKFKKTIEDLSKNKKIILLYPTPVSPEKIMNRILKYKNQILNNSNFFQKDFVNYSVKFHREYFSEEINLINSINSKNIFKIDLEKTFCPENQCFLYDNKNIYIFDTHHPSYEGSKKINNLIMKEIEKIELKSN